MKVLFVAPRYHTNMVGWIKALKSIGCEVEVNAIVKGKTENYQELTPNIFELSRLSKLIIKLFGDGGVNLRRGFPKPIAYFKALRRSKADVMIVRDIGRWFSMMSALYARVLGINIIIYSQIPANAKFSKSRRRSINFVNRLFNSIWMTPINSDKTAIGPRPDRLVYIPFVVDIEKSTKPYNADDQQILTVGKFVKRKQHLLLLSALSQLKNEGYKFKLTIVGEISTPQHHEHYNEVTGFITEAGLQPYVTVKTNQPHTQMKLQYKQADIFVLPATLEPAGISVLEAMGYSLPIICSTTCGTKSYVDHMQSGYVFKDLSLDDLKTGLKWYLDNNNKEVLKDICYDFAEREISAEHFLSLLKYHIKSNFNLDLY